MSNFKVTPIIGLPRFDGWAQAISNPSQSLVVVFSIHGKNASSVGKTIAEELSTLEINSSAELHSILLDLIKNVRSHECRLQLTATYIENNSVVFLAQSGHALLKRGEKVGDLIVSNGELKVIQGKVTENDLIILATQQSTKLIDNIKRSLEKNNDLDLAITEAVSILHQWDDSSLSSLVFLRPKIKHEASKENSKPTTLQDKIAKQQTQDRSIGDKKGIKLDLKSIDFKNTLNKFKKIDWSKVINPIKKSTTKILPFIKTATSKIKTLKNPFSKKTSFTNPQEKKVQQSVIVGGIVIITLLGVVGLKQWQVSKELKILKKELNPLVQQMVVAQGIAESNPLEARVKIQETLRSMRVLVEKYQGKKASLAELRKEIIIGQSLAEEVSGIEEQNTLEPFFDLRLTTLGFIAQDSYLSGKNLTALDKEKNQTIILDIESKKTSTISLEKGGNNPVAIATSKNSLFVIGEGIHSFSLEDKNHLELKEEGDSDRDGTLLTNFGSYLYVFNPVKRNIYRYIIKDDGLSDAIGWLTDKRNLDFSSINNMVIDGDIWLGTKNGEVLKYTQGKRQEFTISGLEKNFSSSLEVATQVDSDILAILESSKERVVFLNKEGLFIKEISSPSLAAAESIFIDEDGKFAFVVSGSLIYRLEI